MKKPILLLGALLLLGTAPAHAYIDPGSGSAIMSALIGFFVAIGVVIKTFWYKIKAFLGLSKTTDKPAADSEAAKQPSAQETEK